MMNGSLFTFRRPDGESLVTLCIAQFRTACFVALVALVTMGVVLAAPARRVGATASSNEATMAREIADDINRERAARNLPAIPFDGSYSAGAQRVAERNRDNGQHAVHSTDHPSGEVVWWGSDYPSSGSPIWWMGSPPHRALLLAPNATRLGVGVACKGTEHDAVAWIETTSEAQNAPAQPVVTKSSAGTRCAGGGGGSSPTSRPTPASVGGGAAPVATSTTRREVVPAEGGMTTTTAKRTSTTRAAALADVSDGAVEVAAPATSAAVAPFAPRTRVIVSASRPMAGRGGPGGTATVLLTGSFAAALGIGRAAHRRRRA
jgi:hypothetical protein